MDEHTLNDLLECSVCLERLDTSSKVLPCQHTFCRKCLEVIVASRNELRCPECRVVVAIQIDDLPPNVLLMRILEGMKNAAAATKHNDPQPQEPCTPSHNDNKLEESHKFNESQQQQIKKLQQQQQYLHYQLHQRQQPQQKLLQQRRYAVPHAYALYDFESNEASDLRFKKGDMVLLKRKIDTNWYIGQLSGGAEGTFPINYVAVIVPLPTPQCMALYDFKMGPNEEEGCLSFKKGMIINVLRRVDHNWAEGRIGATIGIFPIAFVELNGLAKQLLDSFLLQSAPAAPPPAIQPAGAILSSTEPPPHQPHQQQQQQHQMSQQPARRDLPAIPPSILDPTSNDCATSSSASSSHTTSASTSPNTSTPTCSSSSNSSTGCNSIGTSPNQSLPSTPQHGANASTGSVRYRNGAKEKRHSLNALLASGAVGALGMPALSVQQKNRHSAEILSVSHSNAGDDDDDFTTMASTNSASAQNLRNNSSGTRPQQSNNITEPQMSVAHEQQLKPPQSASKTRVNIFQTSGQPNAPTLPWGYLALFPYKPLKSDELELKKGCVYIVTERCLDGWFKGKNWQETAGVFPGNYVTPLRSRDQQQLMHQRKFVTPASILMPPLQAPQILSATSNAVEHCSNASRLSLLQQPPELPPRYVPSSVWTKPLSHTVESFFSRHKNPTEAHSAKDAGNEAKEHIMTTAPTTTGTPPTGGSGITSTTAAAVSLMKRFTNMKTRSKSPNASSAAIRPQPQQQAAPNEDVAASSGPVLTAMNSNNCVPLHVRSGSCPSQLLQSLPIDLNAVQINQQQHQKQQHQQALQPPTLYGSHRIKGSKERPSLPNMVRQSMDGTFRSPHACSTTTILSSFSGQVGPGPNQNPYTRLQNQPQQQHYHRKSHSLDANALIAPMAATTVAPVAAGSANIGGNITAAAIAASATTKSTQTAMASRFRCVVPYPPNSEIELELHVGDIIYVHRKQKNGWYKGTHARTNKTGLFPASFVEEDP